MDAQNPEAILQRIEELRRWQVEQQAALQQKQIDQRELLNLEQQKLYEMFGLSVASSGSRNESIADATDFSEGGLHESRLQLMRNLSELVQQEEPQHCANAATAPVAIAAAKIAINTQTNNAAEDDQSASQLESGEAMPKRTFLKRGEGLRNRFGLHPDALRINNLPRYKYAGAHRKSRFFQNAAQKLVVRNRSAPTEPWQSDRIEDGEDQQQQLSSDEMPTIDKPRRVSTVTEQTAPTWASSLAAPSERPLGNFSMQDTPIREKIRAQQAEIDELNDFELLEVKAQNETKNPSSQSPPRRLPESCEASEDSEDDEYAQPRKLPLAAPGHVRFQSHVVVNPAPPHLADAYESTDTDELGASAANATEKTSTPNTHSAFRAFKVQLFQPTASSRQPNNPHYIEESTITDEASHLIASAHQLTVRRQPSIDIDTNLTSTDQLTETLRTKVAELESEIVLFRRQNAALTAAAQQHQLDCAELAAERRALDDRLADERTRLEMLLHDERMKLVADRADLERRVREQRAPNRREREETAALRANCEQLQREAAATEQRHVAAQARLRAQLRAMEKDVRDYGCQLEHLRTENKKLDAENVRLRRQSNNKMLTEINRNIAKLAVGAQSQVAAPATAVATTSTGPSVAKAAPTSASAMSQTRRQSAGGAGKPTAGRARTRSVPIPVPVEPTTESDSDSAAEESAAASKAQRSRYFKSSDKPDQEPNEEKENSNPRPESRFQSISTSPPPDVAAGSSKREILNPDGSKDILYPNGNLKKVSADAMRIRMLYFNKDIKETNVAEGTVKYYYADTNTWQTSYLDGLEIFEFPSGQIEHRHRDGKIEVHFPNGSVRLSDPGNGALLEEWRYADGTRVEQRRNGERVLLLANGQREVHTAQHKRREYPDGTVKLVYPDGSQETRYSNGRVRLKNAAGALVMDSESLGAAAPQSRSAAAR